MTSKRISHRPASAAALLAACALAAAPAAGAATNATPPPNTIIGGTTASNAAVVQLQFGQNGGTYGCTGEVISSQWVLTAQHCTDGIDWMNVYLSNSTSNRGTAHPADSVRNSPYGDVALVHLASPVSVAPLKMANSYTPASGQSGVIMGYGLRANKTPSTGLYKATVNVIGSSTDAYGGRAIHVRGVDGASNHGDSGGPLFVNNVIVGVCSTGDVADPGSNKNATSNYANLSGSRQWIANTAGV